jgi:hypothetical protein
MERWDLLAQAMEVGNRLVGRIVLALLERIEQRA